MNPVIPGLTLNPAGSDPHPAMACFERHLTPASANMTFVLFARCADSIMHGLRLPLVTFVEGGTSGHVVYPLFHRTMELASTSASIRAKIKHSCSFPGSSSPVIDLFRQFLPQYLIYLRWIRLALGGLHHLTDQGIEGFFLARLEFLH